jgi:hypothetical protein
VVFGPVNACVHSSCGRRAKRAGCGRARPRIFFCHMPTAVRQG